MNTSNGLFDAVAHRVATSDYLDAEPEMRPTPAEQAMWEDGFFDPHLWMPKNPDRRTA